MMRSRERIRRHLGEVKLFATTRGWTVAAYYWLPFADGWPYRKMVCFRQVRIPDDKVTDALVAAQDWLRVNAGKESADARDV